VATSAAVRNLAYLALRENDQFEAKRLNMCDVLHVQVTHGVPSIRVFSQALGRASLKTWIYRHATFFFSRLTAASL
jgi:hypothetical protein